MVAAEHTRVVGRWRSRSPGTRDVEAWRLLIAVHPSKRPSRESGSLDRGLESLPVRTRHMRAITPRLACRIGMAMQESGPGGYTGRSPEDLLRLRDVHLARIDGLPDLSG